MPQNSEETIAEGFFWKVVVTANQPDESSFGAQDSGQAYLFRLCKSSSMALVQWSMNLPEMVFIIV